MQLNLRIEVQEDKYGGAYICVKDGDHLIRGMGIYLREDWRETLEYRELEHVVHCVNSHNGECCAPAKGAEDEKK